MGLIGHIGLIGKENSPVERHSKMCKSGIGILGVMRRMGRMGRKTKWKTLLHNGTLNSPSLRKTKPFMVFMVKKCIPLNRTLNSPSGEIVRSVRYVCYVRSVILRLTLFIRTV
jgi:hypothetical protein